MAYVLTQRSSCASGMARTCATGSASLRLLSAQTFSQIVKLTYQVQATDETAG